MTEIIRFIDQADRATLIPAIEAIFFEASSVKVFASEQVRAAFRQRWLGLYLDTWPEHVFVARDDDGTMAGYLLGCLIDPACDERFDDIGYFKTFAAACAAYSAHLHINLAPAYRSRGIGADLIEAFASHARQCGAPGLHIVTSKDARNVRFYRQCGFVVVDETPWKAGAVVFMGRGLGGG
jgi:GNAT superfamily N-acetyltransferase